MSQHTTIEYKHGQKLLPEIDESKLNWRYLSENPAAIQLLIENPGKINWDRLSCNPAAIQLLLENPDKINWFWMSENPGIFGPVVK